jgi:hypothetical protein
VDSLTTQYLARELDVRWRGRRIRGGALRAALREVVLHVEGCEPVSFDLSTPETPVRVTQAPDDGERLSGWIVTGVTAPLDERRLEIGLERPGKFRGSPAKRAKLEISVVPTARGAMLRDAGGRLAMAIGSRLPRPVAPRPELAAGEVDALVRAGDADGLLAGRWMSPSVVQWLVSDATLAVARYREIIALPPAQPCRCAGQLLPLPLCDDAAPADSLIDAPARPASEAEPPAQDAHRARALERMRAELTRAEAAPRWRAVADRLMTLGDAPAPTEVTLDDGARVTLEPRGGERAMQLAERLYRTVRSMERAAERLPERLRALEAAPRERATERAAPDRRRGRAPAKAAPYRRYRSSGGLEILVGRGAASNDALTFRVAAPEEVWLHARGAAGAHVVLRWSKDEPPPSRDLHEAAALAAWHSKSRGSAVVPVDWTRRKYVRRPRGAAPGLVVVTRADTLMARPDEALERSLRASALVDGVPNE